MAINVFRITYQQQPQWAVLANDQLWRLPGEFATTGEFLTGLDHEQLTNPKGEPLAWDDLRLLSPVTSNQQFVCQGANYRQHMIESGMDPDAKHFNMIFTKATSCLCAADADVIKPNRVEFLDYEIELGVVLKKAITTAVTVTDATLHEYVAGITIVNDYSARDVQIPEMQFYKGKSFRTFGPVGPRLCLLDAGEMDALKNLDLQLTVNGETRQRDNTGNLVFGMAETLTELSGVQDLYPGDLIATGTPSGCALSIPSPVKQRIAALLPETRKWALFAKVQRQRPYLQPGDVVEARIASPDGEIDLGTQRNRIVAESHS